MPRTKLTFSTLIDSEEPAAEPIHTSYFSAFGHSTGPAHHVFQGRIEFGPSRVVGRPAGNQGFRTYPDFPVISLDFFTVDDGLVPQERHSLITRGADSPWDLIVEPGRVWSEAGDNGWSRAAFPFALVEKQGTLLRNGVATFVYNADKMSPIHFQIGKESTAIGHLDLWGLVQASYMPDSPPELQAWIDAYSREVTDRIDIHPWSELEARFGAELLGQYDGNRIRRHISQSGLIIDGETYSSDCHTRYGPQPYCRYMRHAVFSVTKPLLGWLTTLRMAQKYGMEILQYKVSDFVELKTDNRHWNDVTFEHLLSMVSGIGDFEPTRVSHSVETLGPSSDVAMLRAATSKEKLAVVERTGFYPWGPGEVFRYSRYDPFILALALSELHRSKEGVDADLWEMMNLEVFRPIGIANLPIRQTQADEQESSVPFFSNGAFVTLEDVAKIEALIRADGNFDGQQILPAELLKESFDGTVEKRGYPTGWINNTGEESRYFRYFWYGLYSSTTGCKVRAPLMSGWGGNAVLIMPNGITALRFASGPDEDNDNDTWDQKPLGRVADGIRPLCVGNEQQ
jgi:CubicO group peptidase (beta-lactamase class C family)